MRRYWSTIAAGATLVLGTLTVGASTASAASAPAVTPSAGLGVETAGQCEQYVRDIGGRVGPITRDACARGARGNRAYCESRLRNPGGLTAKEAETACDFALRH